MLDIDLHGGLLSEIVEWAGVSIYHPQIHDPGIQYERAKNTILAWERKFLDLQQVLFLYALVHECLEVVIEGDEA